MMFFPKLIVLIWADVLALYVMWMMMLYLTNVWKLGFTHAAGIVNIFTGAWTMMLLPMQYLVDTFMGSYLILLLSSISYSLGLGFLWMSTPPILGKSHGLCGAYLPECIGDEQRVLFYAGLALIAVGLSGHLISLGPFSAAQFTEDMLENMTGKSFCIMFLFSYLAILVPIGTVIAISYVKAWSFRFGLSALCTVVGTLVFFAGSCSYNYIGPQGSPLTTIFRVFYAAVSKIFYRRPKNVKDLYEIPDLDEHQLIPHSRSLRFVSYIFLRLNDLYKCLDKAAIILPRISTEDQAKNRWRLCRVTEVEEIKMCLRLIPIGITFIFCGVVSAVGNSYFLIQSNHLNEKLGRLPIPATLLLVIYDTGKTQFGKLYYKLANKLGGSGSRHYAPPIGIAVSMIFSVICCVVAAKVEARRLGIVISHGLIDKPDDKIPMSIFWLLPQFVLLGAVDGILETSLCYFLVDQVGPSMQGHIVHFGLGVLGMGHMGSVLAVYVVGKVSEKGGKTGWFQHTLNKSRLDKYYWTLAWLSAVNLGIYVVMALLFAYQKSRIGEDQEAVEEEEDQNGEGKGSQGPFQDDAQCFCCC
ncbi:protein NRT1/ PTR FAMILY 5.5-like [Impatiens glandulifera]|uniref:protein NRT1/ PTR FAMILY 5.5-like n=1 Tax=Impatiens glandulifera TaxID=253017 RepID=UPI001FB079CE|nr:protein NRT1/ PTR FAMILY 5.5-like [Impatiens glandulifera]